MTLIVSDRRYRKQQILDSIDALIREAPCSEDIEGETERIVLPADSGQFTLLNSKETLRNAREHINRSEARRKYESPGNTRPKILNSKKHKLPKLGDIDTKVLEVVSSFTADSRYDYRDQIQQIQSNGQTLIATNGKMYIQVNGDFPGKVEDPVYLDPNSKKEIEQKGKFPEADFNESDESFIQKDVSTTDLLTQLYIVLGFLRGSDSHSTLLFHNADGTFGFTAVGNREIKEIEMIEISIDTMNMPPKYIGTFNAIFLQKVLESIRLLGFEKFNVSSGKPMGERDVTPLVLRTPRVLIMLMPIAPPKRNST